MICCNCGKEIDINYGREYWNGIYCKKCAYEMLSTPEDTKKYEKIIADLQVENAALRAAAEYMIEAGGIDCCARCIFAENGTEENHYDCGRSGECLEGMIRFAKRSRGGGNG